MSTKRKLPAKLAQPAVKPSAKPAAKESLDDSRAVISSGAATDKEDINGSADVVEISSDSSIEDEEEDDDDDDEVEDDTDAQKELGQPQITSNNDDVNMGDAENGVQIADETEEQGEPSFGDLILANTAETIDVAGAFNDSNLETLSYPKSAKLQPPSGASLGTVLAQALKTNDLALLESCLQTPDIPTIRATIQRLDSPLAGTLLQKIAERLHRRPGRAGSLMVWVQWTLVTHGGYLATQPDLIKKLAELNRVIDERARGLQSLLSLKGKLDMLEAQMQLRQSMRQQRRDLEDDEDEGVIYVEGEEEDEEQPSTAHAPAKAPLPNGQASHRDTSPDNESQASEPMPNTSNGIPTADSDDDEEEDDEDSELSDLIDDEAEETDAESGDEDEVDHSDVDALAEDDEDEGESDDAAPPAEEVRPSKMRKTGALFSRNR